jgi:hypothetical protein
LYSLFQRVTTDAPEEEMNNRARTLIQRAEADSAAYLPGATGNEAERARMLYQIGILRSQVELLCDECEPRPVPVRQHSAKVEVEGVEMTVHFIAMDAERFQFGTIPAGIEVQSVYVGSQDVLSILDADTLNAIQERVEAGEVVA